MKEIQEKVSYLQGLSEGLNITADGNPQGKIISGILGVLGDISEEVMNLHYEFENFKEYVQNIDDDLFELEETLLYEDMDDRGHIEVECTNCGEKLSFDIGVEDDRDNVLEIVCPNCNEVVFVNDGSFDFEHSCLEDEEIDDSEVEKSPQS